MNILRIYYILGRLFQIYGTPAQNEFLRKLCLDPCISNLKLLPSVLLNLFNISVGVLKAVRIDL